MRSFILAAVLAVPFAASAACSCMCVNGSVRQICQSPLDMPALCSPQICPLVPPSIQPMAPMGLPPLGTSRCRQVQVWNGQQYVWRVVCS